MIEKKYIESCSAMLGNEKGMSYLCLMLTNDNMTGVDIQATTNEMSVMLANAALNNTAILRAMNIAYILVKEYLSGISNLINVEEGGGK